ncbi:hypothetical protein [Blastochloris sulfoviridis]|uniref:Uncharacterized protein n=1 Tax=Blastochloris sulfoviridis TaxID=50712 RepID=A0A5M6I3S5_9HYPH|nr:hypothetical protein [Blastochloris sulfoviridis]KAA5602861.1 hypothetical protein F1193_03215 [Blastochloris sulfoviridis]
MSRFKHLPGEVIDAALRFGAVGAAVSGGIVAGQQVSAVRRGEASSQQAVARTLDAAATGGLASAVGGAAAAAIGGHGVARLAVFLAGAAVATWAMSPKATPGTPKPADAGADAGALAAPAEDAPAAPAL